MKIYIACPYPRRADAIELRTYLEAQGKECCARWLHPSHDGDDKGPILTDWTRHALEDLEDVVSCDLLIALNFKDYENAGTGGRHVELGIAIALGKPVILIGERTNVFHHLPSIVVFKESDRSIALFEAIHTIQERMLTDAPK